MRTGGEGGFFFGHRRNGVDRVSVVVGNGDLSKSLLLRRRRGRKLDSESRQLDVLK
jgi:hypothetical protein